MSPEIRGQTGEGGEFGKWDVYPLFVQEAGRLADRRQITNNLFLSINSVFVGAIAVLVQQSELQSVKLLVLEVIVAFAGFLLSRQWLRLLGLYRRLLAFRYDKLQIIENMPGFPGALKMYDLENKEGEEGKIFGFSKAEEFIPKLFLSLYALAAVLLILGTVAVRNGWLDQLSKITLFK